LNVTGAGRDRALVLRQLGLGDLLATVPALRALRSALPEHELLLACPAAVGQLLHDAGLVDEVLTSGELEPVPWSGPAPQVGVDLHGNGPASRRLVQALRPSRLVCFGAEPDIPGPPWRRDEHESHRWCRLVQQALGAACEPDDRRLPPPRSDALVAEAVVLHVGAASGSRRWPSERFAQVAAALAADHRVVLTGSAAERPAAEQVAASAGLSSSAVLAGRTSLDELAALVAAARLVVCGDTGVAHLASAYARPSVLLFGPIPPAWWGPPSDGPHTVLWHGTAIGDPHADDPDPALMRVTVAEVLAAVDDRLT
jgi:ADP-heptose:LPS heptosyltransferase